MAAWSVVVRELRRRGGRSRNRASTYRLSLFALSAVAYVTAKRALSQFLGCGEVITMHATKTGASVVTVFSAGRFYSAGSLLIRAV